MADIQRRYSELEAAMTLEAQRAAEDAEVFMGRVKRFARFGVAYGIGLVLLGVALVLGTVGVFLGLEVFGPPDGVRRSSGFLYAISIGFGLATAGIVGKSLLTPAAVPEGIDLDGGTHPALFASIERVRARLDARPVDAVRLVPGLVAATTEFRAFGLVGRPRRLLFLGTDLLAVLPVDELEAVIGHELGHTSGRHGRRTGWVRQLEFAWASAMADAQKEERAWYGDVVGSLFLDWYWRRFKILSFVHQRQLEYEADEVAARVHGPEVLGRALCRCSVADGWLRRRILPELEAMVRDLPHEEIALATVRARAMAETLPVESGTWLAEKMNRVTDFVDTHPCLRDRLARIGVEPSVPVHHDGLERGSALLADRWLTHLAYFDQKLRGDFQHELDTVREETARARAAMESPAGLGSGEGSELDETRAGEVSAGGASARSSSLVRIIERMDLLVKAGETEEAVGLLTDHAAGDTSGLLDTYLGQLQAELGRHHDAIEALERALRKSPFAGESALALYDLYAAVGQAEAGAVARRRCLAAVDVATEIARRGTAPEPGWELVAGPEGAEAREDWRNALLRCGLVSEAIVLEALRTPHWPLPFFVGVRFLPEVKSARPTPKSRLLLSWHLWIPVDQIVDLDDASAPACALFLDRADDGGRLVDPTRDLAVTEAHRRARAENPRRPLPPGMHPKDVLNPALVKFKISRWMAARPARYLLLSFPLVTIAATVVLAAMAESDLAVVAGVMFAATLGGFFVAGVYTSRETDDVELTLAAVRESSGQVELVVAVPDDTSGRSGFVFVVPISPLESRRRKLQVGTRIPVTVRPSFSSPADGLISVYPLDRVAVEPRILEDLCARVEAYKVQLLDQGLEATEGYHGRRGIRVEFQRPSALPPAAAAART